MSENIVHVAVDLGYGFVKAISSFTGKRVVFPSLVGRGHDLSVSGLFNGKRNDLSNIHISYENSDYFIGDLAKKESRGASRIFEQERFEHLYTKLLLNTAIHLVTDGNANKVNLSTRLPLDFYQSQRKKFRESLLGLQPLIEWKAGKLSGKKICVNINDVMVFPQGASAIFSALINHEGRFAYPHLMDSGNLIALIDIGFRTTDYIVVELQDDNSFIPKVRLSGTIDNGVVTLYQQIKQRFKEKTGGSDLNESHMARVLRNGYLKYKGKRIDFIDDMEDSKNSIASDISDRLKGVWVEETDLFDAIFLAGGGGELFYTSIQSHFDNRLELIKESQFANVIGYLRLGKSKFDRL